MRKDLLLGLGVALAASAQAQVASDVATNSPYVVGSEYIQVGTAAGDQTNATNGMNGGFGFNAWQRGGYGSAPNFGTTLITNLSSSFNMGTQQFGMRSGNGGADARRKLANPMAVGQTFSASILAGGGGAGTANTTGSFGIAFRSANLANPNRDMLSLDGAPGGAWTISDLAGTTSTGINVTAGLRLDFALTMTGGDAYKMVVTPFGGSAFTKTGSFQSTGVAFQTAQFYVFGTDGDFYANNLAVTPEPGTVLALGLGFAGLVLRKRRR